MLMARSPDLGRDVGGTDIKLLVMRGATERK